MQRLPTIETERKRDDQNDQHQPKATRRVPACVRSQTSVGSIAVTASPNPAARPGANVTLTNTGATNPDPNVSTLIYDYYQPGIAACAATAANERSFTHGSGFINTLEQNTSANFSEQTSFVPVGGVRYRICAYLYSGGDDSVAQDAMGTTLLSVPGPPTAITGQASPVHATTASVHGRANPDGAATTSYVQYGPTGRYGSRTATQTVGGGFSARPLSTSLPALKQQSTYHYRIVATNRFGTMRGHDAPCAQRASAEPPALIEAPARPEWRLGPRAMP